MRLKIQLYGATLGVQILPRKTPPEFLFQLLCKPPHTPGRERVSTASIPAQRLQNLLKTDSRGSRRWGQQNYLRRLLNWGEKGQFFPQRGRFGSDLRDLSALGALGFLNKAESAGTRCDSTCNYCCQRVIKNGKNKRDASFGGTRRPDADREAARGALIHLHLKK